MVVQWLRVHSMSFIERVAALSACMTLAGIMLHFKTTHQEISPTTKGKAGFQQGPNTSFSSSRSFMESVFPR
jgi:hypothetical protein